MSLQNILVPNNDDIYCKKLTSKILNVDIIEGNELIGFTVIRGKDIFASESMDTPNISLNEIYSQNFPGGNPSADPPIPPVPYMDLSNQDEIIVNADIVPGSTIHNLGKMNDPFNEIMVKQINSGITTIPTPTPIFFGSQLSGSEASLPIILKNGFQIAAEPSGNQSIFSKYLYYHTPVSPLAFVGGPFDTEQTVNYSGSLVGNIVTLSFGFNLREATINPAFIKITGININLAPSVPASFIVPVKVGNTTYQNLLGIIQASTNPAEECEILIGGTPTTSGSVPVNPPIAVPFTDGVLVGLGIPDGTYFSISYHI